MIESKDVCTGPPALTKEERARIISRIHSLLYWVGEMVPQEIREGDRSIPLRDVVYNYLTNDNPTEEEKRDAAILSDLLEKRVRDLEESIRMDDVDRKEACGMMNEARSYLRAVDELRSVKGEDADVKRHQLMAQVDDARRWKKFIDTVK